MAQAVRTRRGGDGRTADLDLGIEDQQVVADVLERVLADENVLYMKAKHYHWNVEGPQFVALAKVFQDQYELLDEVVHEVAERMRAVGAHPLGSYARYLDQARLEESTERREKAETMVETLLGDHEAMARHLRDDITACKEQKDEATADLLIGLLRKHERAAWVLRSLRG